MSYREHDDAIRAMLRRARVSKVDDSGSQQLVDLNGMKGDQPRKVFRPQGFGLSSNPPADSEGVILALGGRNDRALYFDGGHQQYRPVNTAVGGTILYDGSGQAISLVQRALRIVGGDTITLSATKIVLDGEVHLGGDGGTKIEKVADTPCDKVYGI